MESEKSAKLRDSAKVYVPKTTGDLSYRSHEEERTRDELQRVQSKDFGGRPPSKKGSHSQGDADQGAVLSQQLPELNFAVVAAKQCGKSTFISRALDLKRPANSPMARKKMSLDGNIFLVCLVELQLDNVTVDNDELFWPDSVEEVELPNFDGVLALYDVTQKESFSRIPGLLSESTSASSCWFLESSARCPTCLFYLAACDT